MVPVVLLRRARKGVILCAENTCVSPENIEADKLFDRFYRADASHNREKQGNGLGLAIAQKIVEAHHGKITVSSTKETGTTFTVTLQE